MLLFRQPRMRFGRAGVLQADLSTAGGSVSPLANDLPTLTGRPSAQWLWTLLTPLPGGVTTEVRDDGYYGLVSPPDGTYTQTYRGIVMPPTGAVEVYESTITTTVGLLSAQSDQSLAWLVRNAVQADSAQSWLVHSPVQADRALAWTLRSAVQVDRALAWSVLNAGQVISDQSLAWTLRSTVQRDSLQSWLVYQSVIANRDLAWAVGVVQSVISDASLAWTMLAAVTRDRSLSWPVGTSAVPPVIRLKVTFTKIPTFVTRTAR